MNPNVVQKIAPKPQPKPILPKPQGTPTLTYRPPTMPTEKVIPSVNLERVSARQVNTISVKAITAKSPEGLTITPHQERILAPKQFPGEKVSKGPPGERASTSPPGERASKSPPGERAVPRSASERSGWRQAERSSPRIPVRLSQRTNDKAAIKSLVSSTSGNGYTKVSFHIF